MSKILSRNEGGTNSNGGGMKGRVSDWLYKRVMPIIGLAAWQTPFDFFYNYSTIVLFCKGESACSRTTIWLTPPRGAGRQRRDRRDSFSIMHHFWLITSARERRSWLPVPRTLRGPLELMLGSAFFDTPRGNRLWRKVWLGIKPQFINMLPRNHRSDCH